MTESIPRSHPYAPFVHLVQKPARYLGGEMGQVVKSAGSVDISVCLTFPDIYDIGMSHLGTRILYKLLNDHPRIACERAFTPWVDMEAQLRQRGLPLLSLESARPLAEFDVLGFSLQFELTFTNVLTILDLAGLPLRAADRAEDAPLILGGGPVATHPEAAAPFFDAFLIGDAEERLPTLLLEWAADRAAGVTRREALIRMAAGGGVYVPALYETELCERSGLEIVSQPTDPRVPPVVDRAFVADLNKHPFPADSPIAAAEAIFDRLSVEIARGCTEGCRFCQAGMIYRPVRERDPDAIVDTIVEALDRTGYDEASLTALSTADYSCIDPLIRKVMSRLRDRRVSLGVSSLRAYGLSEPILDEIRSVRATGLTFAPEAGTQRMRDIVNKNVSEADIAASAHRVFSRGWKRMKLYFMIGLPLEEPEDVAGIVETASRMRKVGRQYVGRRAEITASVSTHVPKPHTPFQWAAMDAVPDVQQKQRELKDAGRRLRVGVRLHDVRGSYLEGIVARGDRRVADVIEAAWRRGCRFDGWDDQLDFDTWHEVMEAAEGFDPMRYLGTLPVDGGLPWGHIDVGLADGFLAQEWKRTLKGKLSPPCGKPAGDIIHHTNLSDATADTRKLVCYHCGVACDLSEMRSERLRFLDQLGAYEPPGPAMTSEPAVLHDDPTRPPVRADAARPEDLIRYRLRYHKTGLMRLQGHSDILRILPRVFRRAQLPLGYSWGFHPKPLLSFSPATPLGTYSITELVDVSLTEPIDTDTLLLRVNATADPGLDFTEARCVASHEKPAAARLDACDYLLALPGTDAAAVTAAAGRALEAESLPMTVVRKHREKPLDGRPALLLAGQVDRALWPAGLPAPPEGALLHLRMQLNVPAARPRELVETLLGADVAAETVVTRIAFWRRDRDGQLREPMTAPPEPEAPKPKPEATTPAAVANSSHPVRPL